MGETPEMCEALDQVLQLSTRARRDPNWALALAHASHTLGATPHDVVTTMDFLDMHKQMAEFSQDRLLSHASHPYRNAEEPNV